MQVLVNENKLLLHTVTYFGSIETKLDKVDFLQLVLTKIAGLSSEKAAKELAFLSDHLFLDDIYLMRDGFLIDSAPNFEVSDPVNLVMISEGVWVVDDFDLKKLREFAKKLG